MLDNACSHLLLPFTFGGQGRCSNLCFSTHPSAVLVIFLLILLCTERRWFAQSLQDNCCAAGRRPHQSLAAVGVAALVRLIVSAGGKMSAAVWVDGVSTLAQARRPYATMVFACALYSRYLSTSCGGCSHPQVLKAYFLLERP